MDRFKYCYGKKRGQKVENDTRWIALCEEKQKINLEFSDDEQSKVEDKENTNHGRRPSRKTFQSNKCNNNSLVFPSRPARPRLDFSDSGDCESPNRSQDQIPPKPVPIEDELRKTENAFASVFRISDDSDDDDDDDDNNIDGDDDDCQVLDDQKDPSVDIDKQHVEDDYRGDDDDNKSDTNDQSDDTDDETPRGNSHPCTISQDSQRTGVVRDDDDEDEESYRDDDDDDEEIYHDDDDDDDDYDDDLDGGDEDTGGVSRSILSSFPGEKSCIISPSTTEFKVTANSIRNSNDDKDDMADGTGHDQLSDDSSFDSFHVGETEDVGGYEADDDTHFHGNQTIGIHSTHDVTTSDIYHHFEQGEDTDVTCDFNGESLATSMITDSEYGKDSLIADGNYSGKCDVAMSCYTRTDKSSIDVSCNTCAEDTSLDSYDNDDSDRDGPTELCDTCFDKSSNTEYSTYDVGTHLESFDSDVHDDNDDDKEEGSDHDGSDASDNDASTLCDNSSSTFPDGTDDDPDYDNNDYDSENQATADTCIGKSSATKCNTCNEESLVGTLEDDDDDDVQSAADDDDGMEDDRKEFDSEISNNTCIDSRNRNIFSSGTHLGSDDDPSNDYCGDDDDNDVDDDDKIEASDIRGEDDDGSDDNDEDNGVSDLCETCITLSLSNSAHLESGDSDHGSDVDHTILCDTCIDKSDACISTEVTQSGSIVNDTEVHGDNDDDDDENDELCNTCIGYSTSGFNRTDETRLHGDDNSDDDDKDNNDDDYNNNNDGDDGVKMVKNSTHLCGDVSRVKLSSPNHDNGDGDDDCYLGNTNASLKDVTTMTSDNYYHASRHSDGEDDHDDDHTGDDDDDADSNKNEITVLSQPSVPPRHRMSAEDDDDSDNHRDDGDDDDDVQEVTCNFNDERNNETIKDDDDDDKDTTIVLCADNDDDEEIVGETLNGGSSGDIDDDRLVHNKTLLPNNDIATRTVDRDVRTEHVMADEDDGEMVAEDDITSLVSLSIMEASFKRDKRAKRESSWRVFVGNDSNNVDEDSSRRGTDRTLTRFNETVVSRRKSVNPRFSIVRIEDDVRRLSESLQALNVGDANRSLDMYDEILKFCGQKKTLNFVNVFTRKWIKSCKKIGEGAYAEVFQVDKGDEVLAIKVIPVRDDNDNGDGEQQSFREILFEMTISRELTRLRAKTDGFVDLRSVWFVSGKYPKVLMDAWDEYDNEKNSENDRPDFSKDQHYVVLGFEMGGISLESFVLTDHLQVLSIIKQTSLSLAIAEDDLGFEHRDLHLGNMLVKSVDRDRVFSFVHLGQRFELQSYGLKVTIIDYTLSRMTRDGCTFFKDLSTDSILFEGQGDIQYDVYRHMKTATGNNWKNFTPATNVLWLKHMVDKILTFAQQCRRSEGHSKALQDIIELTYNLSRELERCRSACQFVERSSIFSGQPFQSPEGS